MIPESRPFVDSPDAMLASERSSFSARNELNFRLSPTSSMIDRNDEGHAMGQSAHQYFIFETAGGLCGIAWSGELFCSASSAAWPAGTSSQTR
jgi:hypothetical protein